MLYFYNFALAITSECQQPPDTKTERSRNKQLLMSRKLAMEEDAWGGYDNVSSLTAAYSAAGFWRKPNVVYHPQPFMKVSTL